MTGRPGVGAALRRQWLRVPERLRLPLAVYAACQTVYLLWWLAFFPGLMSYDSITYVWQVSTDNWTSDHSILYDSLLWLSLQTTGDVWPLTLLQTVAVSGVLAYTCVALRDLGVRGRWSGAAALAVAALPSTGSFTEFVWKDAAFGISMLLAFAATTRLVARRMRGQQSLRDRWFYVQLALLQAGFTGIALFRTSSVTVVVAALPLLLVALRGMRLWITGLAALTAALYLVLNYAVYPGVGIARPDVTSYYALNYADIAVAYGTSPGSFTAADKAVMAQVAPLSVWGGRAANCWDVDWTMNALDRKAAARLNSQLVQVWWRVLDRTPQTVAQARLCRSQIAWGIWPGPAKLEGNTLIASPDIPRNLFGQASAHGRMADSRYRPVLQSRPPVQRLHSLGRWLYQISTTSQLQWLVWRGAFWCYASYATVAWVALRRRQVARPMVGMVAIVFGMQMSVIIAITAALARYMLPAMLIGLMTLPLLDLLRRPGPGEHPAGAAWPGSSAVAEARLAPAKPALCVGEAEGEAR
ncbi:hypothetical protein [Streptacidiphilus cavernicola]|uniref:Glycosyltransferase RgtA/B/C/D-like domain-containing protein n=1 Tax=Streptacidiphilus cavernicola TaxID=3342716 RepID=A0ABV6VZ05_9ACTN